jgi:hypothetical protein
MDVGLSREWIVVFRCHSRHRETAHGGVGVVADQPIEFRDAQRHRLDSGSAASTTTRSSSVTRVITDPAFRVPATAAAVGPALYAVNARLDVASPIEPAPTVEFEVVRVLKQ